MPKPERPESLARLVADLSNRIARQEQRDAFGAPWRRVSPAGGLYANPVPIIAPDAAGWFSVTSATWVDVALFAPALADRIWVVAACNGVAAQMNMRLYLTAEARVLGTEEHIETHATLGPVLRVQGAADTDLAVAASVTAGTVVLQAQTSNSAVTNKLRIVSTGWGTSRC